MPPHGSCVARIRFSALTDAAAAAVLAHAAHPPVLADAAAAAVLAHVALPPVLADAAAAAVLAPAALLLRCRPCSQMPLPPQSLHLLRCRSCSQMLLPPQSLHLLRCRPCSQFLSTISLFVSQALCGVTLANRDNNDTAYASIQRSSRRPVRHPYPQRPHSRARRRGGRECRRRGVLRLRIAHGGLRLCPGAPCLPERPRISEQRVPSRLFLSYFNVKSPGR